MGVGINIAFTRSAALHATVGDVRTSIDLRGRIGGVPPEDAVAHGGAAAVRFAQAAEEAAYPARAVLNERAIAALCPGPTQTEFFDRNDMAGANVANGPWMMKASDVAKAGFAGLMKGKMIVIPGFINKLLAFSVGFTPRKVTAAIICYLNQQ